MTGESNYPNPSVDLAAFNGHRRSCGPDRQALDGSKKVIAEKNKQREVVIKMLRLLGRYVEITCKEDMAIFKSSGFEPASTAKVAPGPLSEKIRKIEHGANSGQIAVWLKAFPKATSYELRYGASVNGGSPNALDDGYGHQREGPVTLSALTPGTV